VLLLLVRKEGKELQEVLPHLVWAQLNVLGAMAAVLILVAGAGVVLAVLLVLVRLAVMVAVVLVTVLVAVAVRITDQWAETAQ
jgi:hypothetical protein